MNDVPGQGRRHAARFFRPWRGRARPISLRRLDDDIEAIRTRPRSWPSLKLAWMRRSAVVARPPSTARAIEPSAPISFISFNDEVRTHPALDPGQTMASARAWLTPRPRLIAARYRSEVRCGGIRWRSLQSGTYQSSYPWDAIRRTISTSPPDTRRLPMRSGSTGVIRPAARRQGRPAHDEPRPDEEASTLPDVAVILFGKRVTVGACIPGGSAQKSRVTVPPNAPTSGWLSANDTACAIQSLSRMQSSSTNAIHGATELRTPHSRAGVNP